ncbi:MAG: response regulator [Elusimicrobia bacterium]|nr:response regulator [Elusimicrobiota bacterium]MDE2236992.1 response regulator [Elusimicrobiota bacterium]MDE2426037.1 response regulator [Elusimicrobiota bacterium]
MATKVLIVDDDDISGNLTKDLLAEAGFEVELLTNSYKAIGLLRANRYAVVLLDILMPGVDGLTICHQIKKDPELKETKVVMVSGKSFDAEKERARQYGASLFIEKPYNVETLAQQIQAIVDSPAAAQPAEAAPKAESLSAKDAALTLGLWGCRSAGPRSSPSRYGRRTCCFSLDDGEHLLIFDGGTGLAELGRRLESESRREAWLFLTHFHDEHVQGLPSFSPAARRGFSLHIAGPSEPGKTLEQQVAAAFRSAPATIPSVEAAIDLYDLLEDSYDILPGVKLTSFYANHPGTTLGFVLSFKGRTIAICPDGELYGESATALQDYDDKLAKLCRGADLLVHNARYSGEDYRTMRNRGHSAVPSVVELAGRAGVKKLLLVHHDDGYSDEAIDRIAAAAARQAAEKGYALQVAPAREGLSIGV